MTDDLEAQAARVQREVARLREGLRKQEVSKCTVDGTPDDVFTAIDAAIRELKELRARLKAQEEGKIIEVVRE